MESLYTNSYNCVCSCSELKIKSFIFKNCASLHSINLVLREAQSSVVDIGNSKNGPCR